MQALIDHIQIEWGNLVKAPRAFVTLVVLSLGLGFGAGMLYYASQIGSCQGQLASKDGELGRYRVALGIDPASKGALIELNNQELQSKAATTVIKLREMCFSLRKKNEDIQGQFNAGKIDKKGQWDRQQAVNHQMSEQFAMTLRGDSFNVDNELRRRLGPDAVRAIVGITPSIVSDDGTRLNLLTLIPGGSGFDVSFTCTLADGIEQMAKLLPSDSPRKL